KNIPGRTRSMKILHNVSVRLSIITIACALAASTVTQAGSAAGRSTENARLIVSRSADFGTVQTIHLFIDGVAVKDLAFNQSYEALLRPGSHVLAIGTTPNPYGTTISKQRIYLEPGKTYALT